MVDTRTIKKLLVLRQSQLDDIEGLLRVEQAAWGDEDQQFRADQLIDQIKTFPEGHICAEYEGVILGFVVFQVMEHVFSAKNHPSWSDICSDGFISNTHRSDLLQFPTKNTVVYGVNLSVDPKAPHGIAEALLDKGRAITGGLGIKRILLGARMPFFKKWHDKHPDGTATEYVTLTRNGHAKDAELAFYEKAAMATFHYLIPDYFEDPDSENYGVLTEIPVPRIKKRRLPRILRTRMAS